MHSFMIAAAACTLTRDIISQEGGFLYESGMIPIINDESRLAYKLNLIAANLPELLRNKRLRHEVNQLNADKHAALNPDDDEQSLRMTTLIVLMITQAYIWVDHEQPAITIPALLAQNLYTLCKKQQRLPAFTYADYVLANWKLLDLTKEITLENIEPLFTFTGSSDEAWFIKIHVAIEAACGDALQSAARYLQYKHHEYESDTCQLLQDIAHALARSISYLRKMPEGCDPRYYWSSLRYYLNGWEKACNTGVRFDGVVLRNKPASYAFKGASGAQSSIIPALDALLGVQHDIDDMYMTMLTFRHYMPHKHILFIETMRQSVLPHVLEYGSVAVQTAGKETIDMLAKFRLEHLNLVKQYIYQPAQDQGLDSTKIAGTGGAAIDDYLGGRYENSR
jgi:indoleamine 2,3-dioxygenase